MIRAALPADVDAMAEAHVAAWEETYAGLMAPERYAARPNLEQRRAQWVAALAAPEPGVFVAEAAGAIIGLGSCGAARDPLLESEGEFVALYLRQKACGRGLGRGLMRAMALELAGRGLATAGAWVLANNARALGFYRALGGVPGGPRGDQVAMRWRSLGPLAA